MAQKKPENIPTFAPLDPPDWTTDDIAVHLHKDVAIVSNSGLKPRSLNVSESSDTD